MSSGSDLDLMQSTDFDDGSNNDLTTSTHLEFRDGTKPLITKTGSGHMSPVRARTMKEYDQQIAELQKENFSLKLRIYFLEERMKNQSDDDAEGVFKQNIELKVEVESLKRDLMDKQELLKKASSALTSVTSHHQTELQQARDSGMSEGQRMAHSELDAVKLCIEGLRKELNTKHEEVENLVIQSKETETKLSDLLTINRQLDSRWRQLERERNSLEMRLEMLSSVDMMTTDSEESHDSPHKGVADEVVRKDRLIEQLRCALKAKDVIIEQVEEEKKETIKETTMQLQKKILELQAKVEQEAPEDVLLTAVESFKDGGRLKSAAGTTECDSSQMQRERKVTRKPVLLNAEVQTIASGQAKDLERLQDALTAREEQLAAVNLSVSQFQMENERLRKQIARRDAEVVQLMDQLEKADKSLKKQDDQMKELRSSLQDERHKNTDKILELDIQYKALLDDGQQHLSNQNDTIHRLTRNLRQKDEQLEKLLQLCSLTDASKTTKVAEILRDLQKKNEEVVEELIAENSLNVKSKNDEIGHLKKALRQQKDDYGRTRKELAVCRQMIADLEAKAYSTDQALQQMTNTLRDPQMELKETKDHHGSDVAGREKLIRQLMASLPNKDKPIQMSSHQPPLSADALVSVHSRSADENGLLVDLQNHLKVKEDQLQEAETRLHNLTLEMNCLRETLLKYRFSESRLVNPELGKKVSRARDRGRAVERRDSDTIRSSKDSGNLSASDCDLPLSIPEKLSADRDQEREIDRNEKFQILEMSATMMAESSNLRRACYENKSQQTEKASTADEDEIIRLQTEIKRLKTLVNQPVTMDLRGYSLTSTPGDRKISTSGAGKMRNQATSPVDDVDTGAMDGDGQSQSGRISSSQDKRKIQARRHLTLPPADLSTSQDFPDDSTLPSDLHVAGVSPNPTNSFGRESRATPTRSNISYLSVESSKRWSLEDALAAERSGLEGDGMGHVMNSFVGALSSFQALLPDDSTLSEMSNAEMKDVICEIKQKVLNQCKALPQGTSLSHMSSSDASSSSHLASPTGNVSSHSRREYDGVKLRQLERRLAERDVEISGLNLRVETLGTELSRSQQTIQTLESESWKHQRKSKDSATLALESELNRLREELESSKRTVQLLKEQMEHESREHRRESQDSATRALESELKRIREELQSSERTVQILKEQMENESRDQQRKSQDSAARLLESELKRLREELESSRRTVQMLKEQMENESRKLNKSPDLATRALESELKRLREELHSSERTVHILKEQMDHQRKSHDSATHALESELKRVRGELESAERTVVMLNEQLESDSRKQNKSQDLATRTLEGELNQLREKLESSERAVEILKERMENESRKYQRKSQDSATHALESELNRLRGELESSLKAVEILKEQLENDSRKQNRGHDSETRILEGELNQLREKLESSERAVEILRERMENESRKNQRKSPDSTMRALESELSRLREELESSERTVHLLKEQIGLNSQIGASSSVGFNPELIVRMAKEIDKMKKELAMRNENNSAQPKGMDHADGKPASESRQLTRKIDRSTSTDDLEDTEIGRHTTPGGKSPMDDSRMSIKDLTDGRRKEGRRIVASDGKKGIDEVGLKSNGLDDLVEAGNRILRKSSSSSLDGKIFAGEKKSQIPVFRKSSTSESLDGESIENDSRKSQIPVLAKTSRSLSLDGESSENESDTAKCLQLETKILTLEATIASQSKQISEYQTRLNELGHRRSVESRLQSGSATPISSHTTPLLPKAASSKNQTVQTTTNDHRLGYESRLDGADKDRGQSSNVSDGLDEVSYKLPIGDHNMSSDFLHRNSGVLSTPFSDTIAANDRAFIQLKNEVQTLKSQLDMYKRENSRLNDTIQMYSEQSLWLPGSSPSVHDASSRGRGTSVSADELLRHQMEMRRHESELQCHLDESHRNIDLLRTRLEELLLFMEDLLPLIDTSHTPMRFASLRGKLNETRSLLADVSQSFNNTYDSGSFRMSQTGSFLSRLDLDSNSTARIEEDDRSYYRSSHSFIHSVNSKDLTLSDRTSEAELGRQQQQQTEMTSLDRINRELEQHLRQKDLELVSIATETAESKSQVAELHDEMEILRMRVREDEERTSVMKMELVDLKLCNESLAKTLEDSRRMLKELGLERDNLDKTNHRLQATFAERNTKVSNLEQELVDSEVRRVKELRQVEEGQLRRLASFEQEHSLLITKIELLTGEVQELRMEVVRERDRSAAAEVARNNSVEKLEDKDSIIRKLKELVKENQMTAEDLGNQLHRLNVDIQEKKLTILKLNKKCEDLQTSLHQSGVSSSLVRAGSLSDMTSTPATNQSRGIPNLKGSKVATEGYSSSTWESGGSTKGQHSVSGDRDLSSKVADGSEHHSDYDHPDKGRMLSPTKDYLDHKPTRDTSDSISAGHPPIVPAGMKFGDPIIFPGGRLSSGISTHDRSAGSLELQLMTAQDTIRLLQTELKIYQQWKRSEYANGEEGIGEMEEEGETLEEAMEEIRQLRKQLEQSVENNDKLRDFLMKQAKQTGVGDALQAAQFGTLSSGRDALQSTRELEMAQREISMHKARISRLQSDLSQKSTQIEAIQVEKSSVQRSLSAMKLKLENALAETRRLKEALDESNELNRTMRLELRLQEMMTKADNKENERGLSLSPSKRSSTGSPSRLQLSDLMTEIRQLRVQMEKTIENNNVLRQKLEEVMRNPSLSSQCGAAKILRVAESTKDGSVVDGICASPKAASLVPTTSRHVASEGKRKDFVAGAVTDSSSSADQLVFAIADRDVYERLKKAVSINHAAIGKLEESIQTIHSQVIEDDRKKDLNEAIQKMRTIANEQMQLIALFWFLNLLKPEKKSTDTTKNVENELLRKQLADLRQRYARAKHAMKGAQERLEANNRKKEEFFAMQKNKKEQAILEQISKTHQVLAQARQNLEAVHQQTSN